MNMKHTVFMGLTVALCAGIAGAVPLVTEDWDVGDQPVGYAATEYPTVPGGPAAGTLSEPDTGGNPGGYLQVDADGTASQEADLIYDTAGIIVDYQGGDWLGVNDVESIWFDFYANGDPTPSNGSTQEGPDGLLLYLQGNGITWYYDLDAQYDVGSMSGWEQDIWVNVNGVGSWYRTDAGAEDWAAFSSTLGDVDEIGWVLTYQNGVVEADQVYGFDNLTLDDDPVPEPGTYAMLGFALVSLGATFRQRLNGMLSRVFKRA